jgi:hypothetical protein
MKLYTKWRDREEWWREGLETSPSDGLTELPKSQQVLPDEVEPPVDWLDLAGREDDRPRHDVPLALMLMLGTSPWQRIDGMGIARQALEAPATGDPRHDLTDSERLMLANGRAWCHAVHADLSPITGHNDPIVLSDANRYAELAFAMAPREPVVATTRALICLRQGRIDDAIRIAHGAVEAFGSLTDRQRDAQAHGSAVLAVVTLALTTATAGDHLTAFALAAAARAMRTAIDIDEAAFASLSSEISDLLDQQKKRFNSPLQPTRLPSARTGKTPVIA